jgi:hypothetical protein
MMDQAPLPIAAHQGREGEETFFACDDFLANCSANLGGGGGGLDSKSWTRELRTKVESPMRETKKAATRSSRYPLSDLFGVRFGFLRADGVELVLDCISTMMMLTRATRKRVRARSAEALAWTVEIANRVWLWGVT